MNAVNKGLPLNDRKILGNNGVAQQQYLHKTPQVKSGKFPGIINTNQGLQRSDIVQGNQRLISGGNKLKATG